jgi:Flp pilus assembly protein TadG
MRLGSKRRDGTVVPLLAVCIVALLAMIALAVDIGMVALARNHSQNAADSGALAGVRQLTGDNANNNNFSAATPAAKAAVAANKVLDKSLSASNASVEVGYYAYDTTKQQFYAVFTGSKPADEAWSAVRVTVSSTMPTFFARVMGINSMPAGATATAVHRPRDVAIILDFSGSMRFNCLSGYPFSGAKTGSMNPDQRIPRFGHWGQITSVMQRTTAYVDGSGQVFAPNNLTIETNNGKAIVGDFRTRDGAGALSNAFVRPGPYDPSTFAVPAPDDWDLQSNATQVYQNSSGTGSGGDLWPRVSKATSGTNYAQTVQHYLFGTTNSSTYTSNTHSKSSTTGPGTGAFDPADHNAPTTQEGYGPNFKGYSMGPGWYGKTFYIWPPDPRWHPTNTSLQLDWRKKFFYNQGTTTPLGGSSTSSTADNRADNSLLWDSSGNWKQADQSGAYSINYTAIIQWIKSGPKVFPDNLRAGRLLYYSAIPDTIPATGGTADQRFWRGYINYVIGSGTASDQQQSLYGRSSSGWGTVKITAKSSLSTTQSTRPYMHYNDNPIRPRLHFWFGPLTMLDFLSRYTNNWLPGTCHESQCWQLKAGVNAALKDIELNHPNDWVMSTYFSTLSSYSTARVSLGRDYSRLKNALFYPFSLLDSLSNQSLEIRPYQNNDSLTWDNPGNVPVGNGGTAPEMSFKIAYNELGGGPGYKGRRGAAKLVIFETDGVPNATAAGNFTNAGAFKSYYTVTGGTTSYSNNHPTVTSAALDVITTMCNLETHATKPGYATPRTPVRVHAIGFGDLFQHVSTSRTDALKFLLDVQKIGNTSAASDTSIEDYKIITGEYTTRISNLRLAFERIMQSGVQVTLIR